MALGIVLILVAPTTFGSAATSSTDSATDSADEAISTDVTFGILPPGDVSAEYRDSPPDPNGLPPDTYTEPVLIFDVKAYPATQCDGSSPCNAGDPINEFIVPETYGYNHPHHITPGLTRFHAVYGLWQDYNLDDTIDWTNDARNEWTPLPVHSMMVFISPGTHPTIYSDAFLHQDGTRLQEDDQWGPDFEMRPYSLGNWTSAPILFTDESLLEPITVTAVANGLLTRYDDGYMCDPNDDTCLIDIDEYDPINKDAATLYQIIAKDILPWFHDENVAPLTDPAWYDTKALVDSRYHAALAAYGAVHTDEAARGDPYASMTTHDYWSSASAWADVEVSAYAPTPSEGFPPGATTSIDASSPTKTDPLMLSIQARTGLWYDENGDARIGRRTSDAPVQDYNSPEFLGTCSLADTATGAPVPLNVTLQPVDSAGRPTTWGPTGAYVLQDERGLEWFNTQVNLGYFDDVLTDLTDDLTVDRYVTDEPVHVSLTCDPNDPGQWVSTTKLLLPIGTFGFHILVTQDPGQAIPTYRFDKELQTVRDLDLVQHGLSTLLTQPDQDSNGYGDQWEKELGSNAADLAGWTVDQDEDGLLNIDEFRWLTIPLPIVGNAKDFDRDNWTDGAEVAYWNNDTNDQIIDASSAQALKIALTDPDFAVNHDSDDLTTTHDPDSDNDGLLDGDDYAQGTFPEHADSDCALNRGCITPQKARTTWVARECACRPGTGDGLNDKQEKQQWDALAPGAWNTDWDRDSIANNLLDPDSDGDEILDGDEFRGRTAPHVWDSDFDGLLDGGDVAVAPGDPRYGLFHGPGGESNVTYTQSADGSRLYFGEVGASDPLNWDTDGDGLPDGWEARFGTNATSLQPHEDLDQDGLTNLQEYTHARPLDWDEYLHGTWWYGTYPNVADTDGDGVTDGEEVEHGTDARDNMSTWPGWTPDDGTGGTWNSIQGNPAINEDLPQEEMDPTNLHYLQNNVVDASAYAEEPEVVDQLQRAVDELIAAAIRQNVTEALDVLYNETPVAPTVGEAAALMNATEDAILALVKCANASTNLTAVNATDVTSALLQTEPKAFADNTTQCVTTSLAPFVDHLLQRTLQSIPDPQGIIAPLTDHTLPGIVNAAVVMTPDPILAAADEILSDPVPHYIESTMEDPTTANASITSTAISASEAKSQVLVDTLLPATGRHPQLYDVLYAYNIDNYWPIVQAADEAARENTDGEVQPIATLDSLTFNLYTERDGYANITRAITGERTCVRLDSNTTTGDANGCDLYANLTVTGEEVPPTDGATGPGWRITPTIRLERARSDVNFDLLALAYLQVPQSPHVMILGYDTTGDLGTASGLPASWEGTIAGYDTRDTTNRSFVLQTRYDDPRQTMPLHLAAGAFRVDVSEPGKPVIPENQTSLLVASPTAPPDTDFAVLTKRDATGQDRVLVRATNSDPTTWDLRYHDALPHRSTNLHLHADLPQGTATLQHTGRPDNTQLTWSSPANASDLNAAFEELENDAIRRAFQINATDVPTTFTVRADAAAHAHSFDAAEAVGTISFLLGERASACPTNATSDRTLYVEHTTTHLCVTGRLAGDTNLRMTADATGLKASGHRPTPDAGSLVLVARDGTDIFTALSSTPAAWNATLTPLLNGTRQLKWTTTSTIDTLQFDGILPHPDGRREDLRLTATNLPSGTQATFDLAADRGIFHAPETFGSIDAVLSTTGKAPTIAPSEGGDYFRVRGLDAAVPGAAPTAYEAAIHLDGTPSILTDLTPDGTLRIIADLPSSRPLNLYFEGHGYRMNLQTTSISGHYEAIIQAEDTIGNVRVTHQAETPVDAVTLAGSTPTGLIHATLTNVPTSLTLTGNAKTQIASLDASNVVGNAELRYASNGLRLATPYWYATTFVGLRDAGEGKQSIHLNVAEAKSLHAEQTSSTLSLDTTFATPGNPATLHFATPTGATALRLPSAPSSVTITEAAEALTWSATENGKSFTYASTHSGTNLHATATSAPTTLTTTWTLPDAYGFTATVTHNAATPLSSFTLTGSATLNQSVAWKIAGTDLPVRLDANFDAIGDTHVTPTDATGADTTAGSLDIAFSAGKPWLPASANPGDEDLFLLEARDGHTSGVIRAQNLTESRIRLHATGDDPLLDINRDGGRSVRVKVVTPETVLTFDLSNAPAILQVDPSPTLGSGGGFNYTLDLGNTAGRLRSYYASDGQAFRYDTYLVPAVTHAWWRPGGTLHLDVSTPSTVSLQFSRTDEAPSHHTDYVALRNGDSTASLAATLTGISRLDLDPNAGHLHAEADTTVQPLVIDLDDAAGRASLYVSDVPSKLDATWNPIERVVDVSVPTALSDFALTAHAADERAGRIALRVKELPAGTTTLDADAATGDLTFQAPAAVGRVTITADTANVQVMQELTSDGLVLRQASEGSAIHVDMTSAVAIHLVAADPPVVDITRSATASLVEAAFSLTFPDRTATATTTQLSVGLTRIEWPQLTGPVLSFHVASAAAGADITLGFVGQNEDRGSIELNDAPSDWTLDFQDDGVFSYAAADGVARTLGLTVAAVRGSFGIDATLTDSPPGVSFVPSNGYLFGEVTTTGGAIGHLSLSVGVAPDGQLSSPTYSGDLLMVDATQSFGDTSGILHAHLPNAVGATWLMPRVDPIAAYGTSVTATIDLATGTLDPTRIQLLHPEHVTLVNLVGGLPASSRFTLKWDDATGSILGEAEAPGRLFSLQHQDADAGAFKWSVTDSPDCVTFSAAPTAEANTLVHTSTATVASMQGVVSWNGGYGLLNVAGAPMELLVDAGEALYDGRVTTNGTGAATLVELLVVPDSNQAVVNRFISTDDYLAMETGNKVPYLGVLIHDLQEATWTIPAAGASGTPSSTVTRLSPHAGYTYTTLSGPGDDMTARVEDAPESYTVTTQSSGGAASPDPFQSMYSPSSGTGAITSRVDVTHVDATSGETSTVSITDVAAPTTVTVTGAEPATMSVTTGGQPLGSVSLTTRDRGNALHLTATDLTTDLETTVYRDGCDNSAFIGQATGHAGTLTWRVTDAEAFTRYLKDRHLFAQCDAGKAVVSVTTGLLQGEMGWNLGPCATDVTVPVHKEGMALWLSSEFGTFNADLASKDPQAMATFTYATEGFRYTVTDGKDPTGTVTNELQWFSFGYGRGSMSPARSESLLPCFSLLGRGVRSFQLDAVDLPSSMGFTRVVQEEDTAIVVSGTGDIGSLTGHALLDVGEWKYDSEFCGDSEGGGPGDGKISVDVQVGVQHLDFFATTGDTERTYFQGSHYVFHEDNRDVYFELDISSVVSVSFKKQPGTRIEEDLLFSGTFSKRQEFNVLFENPATKIRVQVQDVPLSIELKVWTSAVTKVIITTSETESGTGNLISHLEFTRRVSPQRGEDACPGNLGQRTAAHAFGPWDEFIKVDNIPEGSTDVALSFGFKAVHMVVKPDEGRFIGTIEMGRTRPGTDQYVSIAMQQASFAWGWDLDGYQGADGQPRYFFTDGLVDLLTLRVRYDDIGLGVGLGAVELVDFQLKWHKPISWLPPVVKRTGNVVGGGFVAAEICLWGKWYAIPNHLYDLT